MGYATYTDDDVFNGSLILTLPTETQFQLRYRMRTDDNADGGSGTGLHVDNVVITIAPVPLHDLGVSPSSASASQPEHKLLLEALRRLPLDTQAMLELHYWEGLSVAEIAEVFDLPVGTVKSRMRKGRQDLEGLIDELGRNPELVRSTVEGLDRWAKEIAERLGRRAG